MGLVLIIEGMTPAEFIAALNANFAEVENSYTDATVDMTTAQLEDNINNNISVTGLLSGLSGSAFIGKINNDFTTVYNTSIEAPTDFAAVWVDNYSRLTWNNIDSDTLIEIWESKNGADYVKAYTTITENLETYDFVPLQNCNVGMKLKAIKGSRTSEFTSVITLKTPIVFSYDQAELHTLVFDYLWLDTGKTVIIDWGDGTETVEVTGTEYGYKELSHEYSETGQYIVKITGDTDNIRYFFFALVPENITQYVYGDWTKLVLPSSLEVIEISTSKIGTISHTNVTNWFPLPANMITFNINSVGAEGNLDGVIWGNNHNEIYISGSNFTGNPFSNGIPNTSAASIAVEASNCYFEGDLDGLVLPDKLWTFKIQNQLSTNKFYGDASSVLIPSGEAVTHNVVITGTQIYAHSNKFTKGFRGHFKWVTIYDLRANLLNSQELDDLLAYIDNYFTDGIVPLVSCTYALEGNGNGIPSAAGLTSKASIEGKYIAAGFTATITVNS